MSTLLNLKVSNNFDFYHFIILMVNFIAVYATIFVSFEVKQFGETKRELLKRKGVLQRQRVILQFLQRERENRKIRRDRDSSSGTKEGYAQEKKYTLKKKHTEA